MYDFYVAWHNTNYLDTPDEEAKHRAALANALAGDACQLHSQVSTGQCLEQVRR